MTLQLAAIITGVVFVASYGIAYIVHRLVERTRRRKRWAPVLAAFDEWFPEIEIPTGRHRLVTDTGRHHLRT